MRLYERAEASVIARAMQDADVETIARHPLIAVGSDGSSLSASGVLSVGKPHPRSYGTNPRFLAQFIRQRQLMALPEAVRKMTTLPASRLGLTRRGRLAPGYAADLVVFDPDTIADTATFEAPHSYPSGVAHVTVNGVLVVENGTFTGQTPGKVIGDPDRPCRDPKPASTGDSEGTPSHVPEPRGPGPRRQPSGQRRIRRRDLDPDQIRRSDLPPQDRGVKPKQSWRAAEEPGDPLERRRPDDLQSRIERKGRRLRARGAEGNAMDDRRDRRARNVEDTPEESVERRVDRVDAALPLNVRVVVDDDDSNAHLPRAPRRARVRR